MRALILALVLFVSVGLAACSPAVRGSMALAGGDYDLALKHYNEALEKDPDSAYLRKRIGLTYFAMQDYARAEASFQDALAHDPAEPEALLYLGLSRIGKGAHEEGLRRLTAYRWPDKYYHQKFVQEEAKRLLNHPDMPAREAIRDLQDALAQGKLEQERLERERFMMN